MKPGLLKDSEIKDRLTALDGWSRDGDSIRKTFELEDFVRAMGFVQSVALLAEKINHHPDIDVRWNKVTLVLSTHSVGGLTDNDLTLASMINSL